MDGPAKIRGAPNWRGDQGTRLKSGRSPSSKRCCPADTYPRISKHFFRPTRSINNARISEIKDGTKHKAIKAASDVELDTFLDSWPNIDPATGLHLQGDELLVKAREAMIAAVHTFNSAGLYFRAELFIVTAIIAWTYLMHAYYKREGTDYATRRPASLSARRPEPRNIGN